MKKRYSYEIALSAVSAAIAVIAVVAQAYVDALTIALNIIAALAINIPLTKGMWKGAIMSFVVSSLIGFLIVNINALPFIMLFGSYAILSWLLDFKFYKVEKLPKALKIIVITVIKIGYYALMFWACWRAFCMQWRISVLRLLWQSIPEMPLRVLCSVLKFQISPISWKWFWDS